jgi:hypothetical protein
MGVLLAILATLALEPALLPSPPSPVPSPRLSRFVPGFRAVERQGVLSVFDGAGTLVGRVETGRVVDLSFDRDRALYLVAGHSPTGRGDRMIHISIEATPQQGEGVEGYLRMRFSRDLGGLAPWKIRLADVDGDGRPELVLGVFKRTRFDPVPRKRLFVYDWPGYTLVPRWLGSRLSLPFEDFAFVDCNGDGRDELVALEQRPGGRRRLMRYDWNGFGFSGDENAMVQVAPDSDLLQSTPDGMRLRPAAPAALCARKDPSP